MLMLSELFITTSRPPGRGEEPAGPEAPGPVPGVVGPGAPPSVHVSLGQSLKGRAYPGQEVVSRR